MSRQGQSASHGTLATKSPLERVRERWRQIEPLAMLALLVDGFIPETALRPLDSVDI